MRKVAFLFPGQGSQAAGMAHGLREASKAARSILDRAQDALAGELDLTRLLREADERQLQLTANTQPAVLAVSVALHAALGERVPDLEPELVAGHSLGEYSALVAARCLTLEDALVLVRKRGIFMQEAVPVGQGSMAAVIGLDTEQVLRACAEARSALDQVVSAANLNTPTQTVIAGHREAVELAGRRAKELGARRVLPLSVSAPFHCELMHAVRPRLEDVLREIPLSRPRPPLVSNVVARPVDEPEQLRKLMVEQVTSPVRWVEVIRVLAAGGVTDVVEIGPGKVLSGLVRGIDDSLVCHQLGSPDELDRITSAIGRPQ